ncbi:metal-dependent hydrolase [Bifidobacterium samirii]|uniref:Metal-dependent hydrolase n=2 Tax=Bifidobacterium samirii TaxID=2306974 RepID=A0A430FVF6_9BIFI|nr:metal-dependent hydrolase [Bifidobacterium samirii]
MTVDGVRVSVTRKRIRGLYLRINPLTGMVEVSAPTIATDWQIQAFVRDKMDWIQRHRGLTSGGRGEGGGTDAADADGRKSGSAGSAGSGAAGAGPVVGGEWDDERRRRARAAIEAALPDLLERWSAIIGRSPTQVTLRLMTTRWGSCTPRTGRIRLNLMLGLMEPRFLEYVLVHEMTHLRAANHGPEFTRLMDGYLPQWRAIRAELNGGVRPSGRE